MAKSLKKATEREPKPEPRVGDRVKIPRAKSALEIANVHHGGDEVDILD